MSWTPADERLFVHQEAPFLVHRISTWTATGSTSRGTDTLLAKDTGLNNLTAQWGQGAWLLQPGNLATATDRHRQIGAPSGGNASDPSSGYIYVPADWGTAPQSGDAYVVMSIPSRIYFQQMLKTAAELKLPYFAPYEPFTNASFQTSSGGNIATWSVTGGSITPSTSAANVRDMQQSGFFNVSSGGDILKSTSIPVEAGRDYETWTKFRTDVGGPFYVAIRDVTNSAEIDSSSRVGHSYEGFHTVRRTFTAPTGCREVQVWIYCTGATDDGCFNYVTGFTPMNTREVILPTWVTKVSQIRKVQLARYTSQIDANVFDANSQVFEPGLKRYADYTVRVNPGAANPARLEFDPSVRLSGKEIWMEAVRPTSDFTTFTDDYAGESVTCNAPLELFGKLHIRNLCQYIVSDVDPNDSRANAKLDVLDGHLRPDGTRAGGELSALIQEYMGELEPSGQSRRSVPMFRVTF